MDNVSVTGSKVLIVDDTPTNLDVLFDYLDEADFEVYIAEDGESAIERTHYTQPDIILLDVSMPGIDGFETCRRLQADVKTKHIPVIFMTALTEITDKVKGFSVGAVDYVEKPLQYEEVLARLKTHITMCRMRMTLYNQNQQLQEENTRRKRVQEALRESRERYRLLAENSTDMISRQTLKNIYYYVSPACRTLLGYEIEEMIGRATDEFCHPEDLSTIQNLHLTTQGLPSVSVITYRARRKDNSYIWLETTHRVLRDSDGGTALEIIAVSRDITKRKETEEALQQANQELQRLANLDGLTQIANRRRFDGYLIQEWLRMIREQKPLAVILADIDYFKSYNDTYGHQMGDDCLRQVAHTISHVIQRAADLAARYGGEEFVMVLPNTDSEGAKHVAQSIHQAIKALKIEHTRSSVSDYVTVSLGVSSIMPDSGISLDSFIAVVDRALYEAKTQGRNCTIYKAWESELDNQLNSELTDE